MEQKNRRFLEIVLLVIILVLFSLVSCKEISEKQNRHIDEYLSYMLANNTDNSLTLNMKNTNAAQEMNAYLTVNENNPPFNYANVWKNQILDTHPPLYYAVLHTVCSFFSNVYSDWFAGGINIFLMCLSLILIFKISKDATKSVSIALSITLSVAINPSIIEMVTFERMYVMAMFWCVLLTYTAYTYIHGHKHCILLGISLTMGALTHYYFILFAAFVMSIVLLNELVNRQIKNIVKLGTVLLVSVMITIAIFPAILEHLFTGNRGVENLSNFFNFTDYVKRIKGYFYIMNQDVFYRMMLLILLIGMLGLIQRCCKNKAVTWKVFTLSLPSVMYFFVVAKVSSYVTDRYMALIYPICIMCLFIGIYYFIDMAAKKITSIGKFKENIVLLVIIGALSLKGYMHYTWDYSNKDYKETIAPLTQTLLTEDCIYIYSTGWKLWSSYVELSQYPNVTFINYNEELNICADEYTNDELVVYSEREISKEAVEDLLHTLPQYKEIRVIYDNYSYNNVYILKK